MLVIVLNGAMAPTPVFASVDVQQLLSAHIAAIGKQSLDAEAQKRDAAAIAGALEAALDQPAQEDHAILLVAPAVLRGVPDVTSVVRSLIEGKLAGATVSGKDASP